MMTEYKWRHLVSWLKDYYIFEYTDIDPNFKDQMIDYVVEHNADVFTKEDVMNRELAKHYREHPEDFEDE